jgi:hypothetical protein
MADLIVAALTFGVCFLLDKGFTKLFRGQKQHKSGLAVRLQKKFALFGLFMSILGVVGILVGGTQGPVLLVSGMIVLMLGLALAAYYLTFGIFYDEDGFLKSAFGRKNVTYRFGDIRAQKLYKLQGGQILVELQMADGSAVSVDTSMEGAYAFLNHAFYRWCGQNGRSEEECEFHDPASCLWFPGVEEDT